MSVVYRALQKRKRGGGERHTPVVEAAPSAFARLREWLSTLSSWGGDGTDETPPEAADSSAFGRLKAWLWRRRLWVGGGAVVILLFAGMTALLTSKPKRVPATTVELTPAPISEHRPDLLVKLELPPINGGPQGSAKLPRLPGAQASGQIQSGPTMATLERKLGIQPNNNEAASAASNEPQLNAATAHINDSVKIQRLADTYYSAVHAGKNAAAARALKSLKALTGKNHTFVLKLEAYGDLVHGKTDIAEKLLQEVLAKQPDDLDAGFNLALVEAARGERHQARARARKLLALYPGTPRLNALLDQLDQ